MKIEVYTDGGCLHNGKKNAQAGFGYYFPAHPELSHAERVPDSQPQTNNRGELLGILEAMKKTAQSFEASKVCLHIYSDSEYSINCLTKWAPNWIAKNWKTTMGKDVANRDLIEECLSLFLQFESYTMTHVLAHTGGDDERSKNNHIVDRMISNILTPEVPCTRVAKVVGPLQLMGPPVSEAELYAWCRANMDTLDPASLRSSMLSAYTKTMKKNGYEVVKRTLHRTSEYRLTAGILTSEE